ncbi:MAG TPA: pyruvate kinase [Spirochaetota bacterium]|nr:pyruvate kinase [Spirochaetota bacterium]HPI89823.1 pyruvate kinase [Spirochaetota bacterium]HPR49393.1 pyruvate kinase [Spirochaetota bacterium]
MRKTKIVCTLGPATDSEEVLRSLMLAGMNVARLNFSHGTHDEHKMRAGMVKKIRDELDLPVALLLDTKGPEIRVKTFEHGAAELKAGQTFVLTTEEVAGNTERVSVTYPGLPSDLDKGDRILLDDGLIEMKVVSLREKEVECLVVNGGTLSNRKSINIPGVTINLPFVSDRDEADLLFGIEQEFDFIAASFSRSPADIMEIRSLLRRNGGDDIRIIAKIENRDGVNNIDGILRVSDGVMVARGDMGVEIPFEEIPAIQKSIILKANSAGKPVITATQMLDSMIRNPRPTRAEITDIANAVYDGTSAIMLSGETSIGKYPVESVMTMERIAVETERNIDYVQRFARTHGSVSKNVTSAISHATCSSAHDLQAAAILTVTQTGHTARMVSRFRPACPVVATTVSSRARRQLSLSWGITPFCVKDADSTDRIFSQAVDEALKNGIVKEGDLVVITGGTPVGVSGSTNTMKIQVVGDVLLRGEGMHGGFASGILYVEQQGAGTEELFDAGNIIVIKETTDEVIPMLRHAAAIITEEPGTLSRAVTVAKTLDIPLVAGAEHATDILKSGIAASVDAVKGLVISGIRNF